VWSYYLGNFDPRRVDNYVYGLLQALIAEGLGVVVFAASLGCLIIGRTARRTVVIMGFVVLVAEVVATFYSFN
jgi:predicted LPLAT superfamily acyltransferase